MRIPTNADSTAWVDFPPTIGLYDYNITCYQTDAQHVIHQYNCFLFEIRIRRYGSIVKLLGIDIGGITEGIKKTTVNQYISTITDKQFYGSTAEESFGIGNISWIIYTVLDIIITLALLIAIIQCICTNRWRTYHISNNSVQFNRENQDTNLNLVENEI